MAGASIPGILGRALWTAPYSDFLQPIFSTGGSVMQTALPCRVLVSLYFDDATITDLKSSRGYRTWAVNQLCTLIGSPFAADKKQMQDSVTFLGLTHNLANINPTGYDKFWA